MKVKTIIELTIVTTKRDIVYRFRKEINGNLFLKSDIPVYIGKLRFKLHHCFVKIAEDSPNTINYHYLLRTFLPEIDREELNKLVTIFGFERK